MRFFTSGTNSRGKLSSIGGGGQGQTVHTRTWTHGVSVEGQHWPNTESVEFEIFATGGSDAPTKKFLIGSVLLDKKGNVKFKKAAAWRK